MAQQFWPPLTTMHVDTRGMGRMAVQLLVNRLEFPDSEKVTAVMRPRLVKRQSVAAPPLAEGVPPETAEATARRD
jgi:LacI family transcriptional regulator